ncbi:MAG: SDR family NAD(P)-dependent oxidoreductase, partial [Myxococcota bacterium]
LHIVPGDDFAKLDRASYRIDPTNPEHFTRLLESAGSAVEVRGIVYLWALDAGNVALETAMELGCAGVLHLVQALAKHGMAPTLWLISRHAQAVAESEREPTLGDSTDEAEALACVQAPLWGLGRVIAIEQPELSCRLLDLGSHDAGASARSIGAELNARADENQIAYRLGRRFVPRLARHTLGNSVHVDLPIEPDKYYLIVGGLGSLGRRVSRWLLERGARHLVLTGRNIEGARRDLFETMTNDILEQSGAEVHFIKADIARRSQVESVLQQVAELGKPLGGVIHAAGVLDDGMLLHSDWNRFRSVLEPKLLGSYWLHELTRDHQLDFFVLFSSLAVLLGSAGQGSYAAANAFQDSLVERRRQLTLPATSINWGAWSGSGMAGQLSLQHEQRLRQMGLSFMSPESALAALEQVLSHDVARIGIWPADWSRYPAGHVGNFVTELLPTRPGDPAATTLSEFAQQLQTSPSGQRRNLILSLVRDQAARVLGLSGGDGLDGNRPLQELGLDSLMAVDLRNVLAKSLGISLPATLVFDHPTAEALTDYLLAQVQVPGDSVTAIEVVEHRSREPEEPIAIVGMACRFPGGVRDADGFWSLLRDGTDAITEVPKDRWELDTYYDPDPGKPGTMYTRWGGFLDEIDQFDAEFFGISPREATAMDPQQRLLL